MNKKIGIVIVNYNEEKYQNAALKSIYAPTCCMLIHKTIFEKIGYIDETYFMYFDDTDF